MALTTHWTTDVDRYVFAVGADFMLQLEKIIEAEGTKQTELASALGVSEGRVSQVLNTPANLTLRKIVQYAKTVGRKVSLVVYDDKDAEQQRGPINGEIFAECWKHVGKPFDNYDLQECKTTSATADFYLTISPSKTHYGPNYDRKQSATSPNSEALAGGQLDGTAATSDTQQQLLGMR